MNSIAIAAFGLLLLVACTSGPSIPDGATFLDEEITLNRSANVDSARREITLDADSVLVALVEEDLTDVRLGLEPVGSQVRTLRPVEVENNLEGAGLEIAALHAPRATRIAVTLTGPQDASVPGRVRLKLLRFAPRSKTAALDARRAAFEAWSAATLASHRGNSIRKSGRAHIDRAIASFEGVPGDARLAAEARLVKANMLQFYGTDMHAARAEAQRAAAAFAALPTPAPLQAARARFIEAVALGELAKNPAAVDPTPAAAGAAARQLLAEVSSAASPFGPVERARAIAEFGNLDATAGLLEEARGRLTAAKALYHDAGHVAGELETLADLTHLLVERGHFHEAAKEFDRLLPHVELISNPKKRLSVMDDAARAQSFSGRTDEAVESLLKVVAQAREFELRAHEGGASQELGYLYHGRGDYIQAKAFFNRALQITREDQDAHGLGYTLQSAGMMARLEGDYATAIAMHEEAVRLVKHPVGHMRAVRQLALDHLAQGNHAEGTRQLRRSLAANLQDPRHHAYADVRRELAQALLEHGDGSRATLAEVAALLGVSVKHCLDVKDRVCEIGVRVVNAALLTKRGRLDAARAEYERAFEQIFEYRKTSANAQLRTVTLGHEHAAFRGYFDLMMRDVVARGTAAPHRASAPEEGALRMLELARESRFGAAEQAQLDAQTRARVDALLAQMADQSLKIATLLKRRLTPAVSAQLEELQLGMAKLRAEVDRERTAAAEKHARQATSRGDARRTWRGIAPGTVQLSYALGNEHAYVWARDAAGTRVAMLGESPAAIERMLTELASLDRQLAPEKVEQALAHVSSVLLPAGLLPADSNAVEVVAEGRIASVPFAGLRSPTDAARRLVETHALTMITSMFALPEPPRSAQARPFRLVALASGSGTLRAAPIADPAPKLQAAIAEIRAIADLFEVRDRGAKLKLLTGNDGNATTLRGIWASGADVVHFATHALADLREPLASLLVLPAADAGGTSTYLTAGQVQEWRGDAGLVFLSTCESAIGPPRFASGMPGLQSAFLRAGARSVIATLWPIEDVLAREFSADFYRRFTGGESALQSLRETQRAWLAPKPGAGEVEQMRRRITALAHGFYTQ